MLEALEAETFTACVPTEKAPEVICDAGRFPIAEAATDPEGRVTVPPETVKFELARSVPATSSVYDGVAVQTPKLPLPQALNEVDPTALPHIPIAK